jgi:hypothetical protein
VTCEETARSLLYRTGEHVYKVRKPSPIYSSAAVRRRYAEQALELGRRWAGDTAQAVVPIVKTAQGYAIEGPGEPVDYALRLAQLPDARWLHRLLAQGKVTDERIERIASFLAERHGAARLEEKAADGGRPEHVQALVDEIAYQAKKYVGQTVSEPMLSMIALPVTKSFDDLRKLFLRRQKRGFIVDGHGSFVPEHLYVGDDTIRALSPLEVPQKYRLLDAASDVAQLVNALTVREAPGLAEQFLLHYLAASKDRDLPRVLPVYRVLQATRSGLLRSERRAELPPEAKERAVLAQEAERFYTVALQAARDLSTAR